MAEVRKTCSTCRRALPIAGFSRRAASRDGLQSRCKDCWREWYAANRADHIAAVRERAALRVAEHRRRLTAYLREHPCVDCGETDLRVLDFDHRDRALKRGEVSRLIHAVSWRRLQREIDLCDVRCSNCHRRRTAEQLGYWSSSARLLAEDVEPGLQTQPSPPWLDSATSSRPVHTAPPPKVR